jgi:hypothetical protein
MIFWSVLHCATAVPKIDSYTLYLRWGPPFNLFRGSDGCSRRADNQITEYRNLRGANFKIANYGKIFGEDSLRIACFDIDVTCYI